MRGHRHTLWPLSLVVLALRACASVPGGHRFTEDHHRVALLAQLICDKAPAEAVLDQGSWCLKLEPGTSAAYGFPVAPYHVLDVPLVERIFEVLGPNCSVMDLGAGSGQYGRWLQNRSSALTYYGCDGALNVEQFTRGFIGWCDLTKPVHAPRADWVLSLEVGEHLPEHLAKAYLSNVHRLNTKGVILSWAVPGQAGKGHVNCQPNEWVQARMSDMGYRLNQKATDAGRAAAQFEWFRNTYMVFERTKPVDMNDVQSHE